MYGCKELERALVILGFEIDSDRGKGGHKLAKHPTLKPVRGQAPYITIKGLKEYASADFRSMVVKEIVSFGFTRDRVIAALNGETL